MKKLTLLFLLLWNISFSQIRFFYGEIYDDINSLENVHIINTNSKIATSTNLQGFFKITAKVNDTIKVSHIGYKTQYILLTLNDFGLNRKKIHLKKEPIKLKEVELKRHYLTGLLSIDSKVKNKKKVINALTLNLPNAGRRKLTISERRLYTAKTSSSGVPLDFIINSISGRIKKLKKLHEIEKLEKEINYLKINFSNYIKTDLKIDTNNLYKFMYYCVEKKNYTKEKNKGEINLIYYLKNSAKQFQKLNIKE